MNESTQLRLPIHPVPKLPGSSGWMLTLSDGADELVLDRAAMARLPHVDLVDDFICLKGWTIGGLTWRGVRLAELLAALPKMAFGPYLAVSAPDTCAVLTVSDLGPDCLLADALDGAPLPSVHGGPYRLVVPGGVCFESVKWVQRIERCDSSDQDTARKNRWRAPAGWLPKQSAAR